MNLKDIPFAAGPIDRAGHYRTDEDWLKTAANASNARFLLLRDGMPLTEGGPMAPSAPGMPLPPGSRPLVWLGPQAQMLSDKAHRIFLGLDENEAPVFALNMPKRFNIDESPIAGLGSFTDMRAAAAAMSAVDAQSCAAARSIFEWHDRHGYCSNCGTATDIAEAGWKRVCDDCGAEHFPRVDPVAIMLAVKSDKCLMGRQPGWPDGFYSCLAGFIEPGETIEQGAARELKEEAGLIAVGEPEYLFCQPWPFPSSLMIGMILDVESEDLIIDKKELESARWFTRLEARDILDGVHDDAYAPPHIAVAHHILKAWAERDS